MKNNSTMELNSEINELLNILGNAYITKIPKAIYNSIISNLDINYTNKYNYKDLDFSNFSAVAIDVISYFDLEYWSTANEKFQKEQFYKNKLIKEENEKRMKYNPDNIFKKKLQKVTINNEINDEKVYPLKVEKTNFIKYIINKIKKYFKKGC